jgi:hypothetical protein
MSIKRFAFLIQCALGLLANCQNVQAQLNPVASLESVIPFATKGSVQTGSSDSKSATINLVPATPLVRETGGRMITGNDGATSLILESGGSARMGADTEISMPTARQPVHSLELLKGRLLLNINANELKSRSKSEFRLKTPTALLAVKGTKFFAISSAGRDIIGVHEGVVMIYEPISKKTMTIQSGEAVDVSPGILEAKRTLSADELAYSAEYDLADLLRSDLVALVESKVLKTRGIALTPAEQARRGARESIEWGNLTLIKANQGQNPNSLDIRPPEISSAGVLRYSMNSSGASTSSGSPETYYRAVGNVKLPTTSKAKDKAPLAVLVNLKATGFTKISFGVVSSDQLGAGDVFVGPAVHITKWPTGSGWQRVLIEVPAGTPNPMLLLKATPEATLERKRNDIFGGASIELKDMTLLSAP